MKLWSTRSVGMLVISVIAASAAAYEHPLHSAAIRNGYFLGSSNSESVNFLSKYKETLPPPKTGPHIAEMEVRTPFAQVVVNSREHPVGYSAQQAKQDYKKDPDTLQVRIRIRYTTSPPPPPACQGVDRMISVGICFHDFEFRFSQSKDIQPIRSYGVPIYSGGDTAVLTGGDVWFTFRAAEVASAPLRVTVSTPGAHEVSATFDLAALR